MPTPSGGYGPYGIDPRELMRLAGDVEVVMGWQISRAAILSAKRLRMISSPHAGMDLFDLKLLREREIMLCNARGVNAVAVAEHTLALMLALAKRIPAHDAAVKKNDWVDGRRPPQVPALLASLFFCLEPVKLAQKSQSGARPLICVWLGFDGK